MTLEFVIGIITVIGAVVGVGVFLMMHIDKRLDDFALKLSEVKEDTVKLLRS